MTCQKKFFKGKHNQSAEVKEIAIKAQKSNPSTEDPS